MQLVLLLAMFSRTSALRLHQNVPIKMDLKKPICDSPFQMGLHGQWRHLRAEEQQQIPKESDGEACWTHAGNVGKDRKLMWEPDVCTLPVLAKDFPAKPRRVVFVGDSVTDQSAQSFAWYYTRKKVSDRRLCFQKSLREKQLRARGDMSENLIQETLSWAQQSRNGHIMWGCNETVGYVPLHTLLECPSPEGFMHIVRNLGDEELGKNDFIVMNLGLHLNDKGHDGQWHDNDQKESMRRLLKEWKAWHATGNGPKLIWRQMSPSHWDSPDGSWAHNDNTKDCSALGSQKQIGEMLKQHSAGLLEASDKYFMESAKKEGLQVNTVHNKDLVFLPIWRATAERVDEHPALQWRFKDRTLSEMEEHGQPFMDCTHYCTYGSVNRFWNSALLMTMGSMQK